MPKPYYFLIFRRKWIRVKTLMEDMIVEDNETVGIETCIMSDIFKIFLEKSGQV